MDRLLRRAWSVHDNVNMAAVHAARYPGRQSRGQHGRGIQGFGGFDHEIDVAAAAAVICAGAE